MKLIQFIILFLITKTLTAQPVISSFTPASGGPNTQIIITGTNFTGATAVSFGSIAATFFSTISSTTIIAYPGNGSTGAVSVTTPSGTTSLPGFTYTAPVITSISPTSGAQGSAVTIIGSNFTGTFSVRFGGVPSSSFTVLSDTSISAVVGPGTSGNVQVTNSYGSGSFSGFDYLGPVITGFSPTLAGPGTTILIYGHNFTGVTAVDFGGMAATSFTVNDDSNISAVVGSGYAGSITIIGPNGSGSRTGFVMPPSITSFIPLAAPAGSTITINGSSFVPNQFGNVVTFGAVKANVVSASSTALTVTVPAGASYGPISVTTNNQTIYSQLPFILTFPGGNEPFHPSSFAMAQPFPVVNSNIPLLVDLDDDRKPDGVIGGIGGGFSVMKNTSVNGVTSFGTPTNYTTSTNSTKVVADDLNLDGRQDLVVVNYATNSITIYGNTTYISTSPISFFPRIDSAVGNHPTDAAIRDLDNDGKPDIAVVNYGTGTISIFRNTSFPNTLPLSLAAKINITVGGNPQSVCLADVDGDGKADMIITNSSSNTISVFRNTGSAGNISFAAKVDFVTGNLPRPVSAGDIDGDGKIDLVIGNGGSVSISVLRNISTSGNITFEPRVDYTIGSGTNFLSICDLNGDGKPDIVAGSFSVFRNLSSAGSISFDTRIDYVQQYADPGIICGDVNGDGKPDIVTALSFAYSVFRNKINQPPQMISFSPVSAVIGDSVVIHGKNLTGLTTIKVGGIPVDSMQVTSDTTAVVILEAETGGTVEVINEWGTASLPGLSVSPVPKIISFTPSSGPIGTTVTINGSDFSSSPTDNIVFFGATRATVLNASSSELTVVVPPGASFKPISVTTNHLIGYSAKPFSVTFPGTPSDFTANSFATRIDSTFGLGTYGFWPVGIAICDIDGDGKPEVNVCGSAQGVAIWRNIGDSGVIAFEAKKSFSGASFDIDIADLNRDGKPDIAAGTLNDFLPAVAFQNNSVQGNVSIIQKVQFTEPALAGFVPLLADLDKDGRPDLILASESGSATAVYRNIGTADSVRFGPRLTFPLPGSKFSLSDIDGDGKLDFCGYGSGNYVNRNISTPGHINFGPRITIPSSGVNTINILAIDVDGDDKPDIVAPSYDHLVDVIRNTSTPGNVSFAAVVSYPFTNVNTICFGAVGDLDGDGKPEIIAVEGNIGKLAVFKNTCTPGNISFLPKKEYTTQGTVRNVTIGDLDNDGKPDIATVNYTGTVSFFRNKISEPLIAALCPPMAATTLSSDLQGTTYQWQVDTGNGFIDIANNANYSGVNTITLQLTAIPSSWNNYKYRCVVDADISNSVTLKFANYWLGAVSNAWENPANWSCGVAPDNNSDVIIASGSVIVLNSNVTVRTLTLRPGAQLTVTPPYILTVTN